MNGILKRLPNQTQFSGTSSMTRHDDYKLVPTNWPSSCRHGIMKIMALMCCCFSFIDFPTSYHGRYMLILTFTFQNTGLQIPRATNRAGNVNSCRIMSKWPVLIAISFKMLKSIIHGSFRVIKETVSWGQDDTRRSWGWSIRHSRQIQELTIYSRDDGAVQGAKLKPTSCNLIRWPDKN